MQIYSTLIPVNSNFSQDDFIALVIEWNQNSPYNKISNLSWDGRTRSVKFEDGNLMLAIEELRANSIIAARFRHIDSDKIIWTSDFILNFDERKLAVRLDRETTQETTNFVPKFKTPVLVNMMLEKGYVDIDNDLEINDKPFAIRKSNYSCIEKILSKTNRYMLPVVYVTKTWEGNYPLNVNDLAYRLRGVAHVLKESEAAVSSLLKVKCNGENVHHGGIGIYFPNTSMKCKRINAIRFKGNEDVLMNKIVNNVCRYMNQQAKGVMYTWEGVQNELLCLKNESLLEKHKQAELEKDDAYEIFNDMLKEKNKEIEELNNRIIALETENQGLHMKIDGMDEVPLLYFGDEEELYEGEIKEIVLDILSESLKVIRNGSRREDILVDILDNNEFKNIPDQKKNHIKRILKGYTKVGGNMQQELKDFGFEITHEGKHLKLKYYGDSRYLATMAKTGSDSRHGGGNLASEIINSML